MRTKVYQIATLAMLAFGMATIVAGCACSKSESAGKDIHVSLAEMSDPARAAVESVTTGGQVDQITKEVERGKVVYDVEATVGGKHLEFLIVQADGAVLGTDVPVDFSELPESVRVVAGKYFGRAAGLKAMKGVEYGETTYEIEGPKAGKTTEVTFDPTGKTHR